MLPSETGRLCAKLDQFHLGPPNLPNEPKKSFVYNNPVSEPLCGGQEIGQEPNKSFPFNKTAQNQSPNSPEFARFPLDFDPFPVPRAPSSTPQKQTPLPL